HAEWDDGVGDAMADQNLELTDFGQPKERSAARRQRAVERNHAGEPFGKGKRHAIRVGSALADAGQVNSLGMNVVVSPRLFDGAEDVVFGFSVAVAVGAPRERRRSIGPFAEKPLAAQAETDEIAPADARS